MKEMSTSQESTAWLKSSESHWGYKVARFQNGEFVKWLLNEDEKQDMVVLSQRKKDKEGKALTDGPWWVLHVPGRPKLIAVVHESKLERL